MKTENVDIKSLVFDPANVRRHDETNLAAIKGSLTRFGQQKPIVVNGDNLVVAGNGTLAAALALGWSHIDVVRTSLKGVDATAYAIADNRTAELAAWDDTELAKTLAALQIEDEELAAATGFTEKEIERLVNQASGTEVTEDDVPETAPQRCNPGDLWQLGEHRLLCGDSTDKANVERLLDGAKPFIMVTDPPYGVEYDPAWREKYDQFERHSTGKVQNDDRFDWTDAYQLFPGYVAYVWHASFFSPEVGMNLKQAGFEIRASIIWRKQHFVFSQGHYHWQHEPCWYVVRKGKTAKWGGDRKQSTIWDIDNKNPMGGTQDDANTTHGTQKPVACMARPIANHGSKTDDVYDPFLGSGTTVIAAEQLGRRCFGLELSPTYCDIIIARWEKLTGKEATKVGDG